MNKIYLLLVIMFVFACKKQQQVEATSQEVSVINTQMDSVVKRKKIKLLDDKAKEEFKDWNRYQKFYTTLVKFQNISPKEAMSYATELKLFSNQLSDSIPTLLKTKSFKARLNVLKNEVYRFEDMTNISSVSAKEINAQIDKLFEVFSSFNTKISSEYKKNNIKEHVFKRDSLLKLE